MLGDLDDDFSRYHFVDGLSIFSLTFSLLFLILTYFGPVTAHHCSHLAHPEVEKVGRSSFPLVAIVFRNFITSDPSPPL